MYVFTQLCPDLYEPMNCSLPGSSICGFSRQQYWDGLSFPTRGSSQSSHGTCNLGLLRLLHWQMDCLPLSHQESSCIYLISISLSPHTHTHTHTHTHNIVVQLLSHVWLCATWWTAAYHASFESVFLTFSSSLKPFLLLPSTFLSIRVFSIKLQLQSFQWIFRVDVL